MTPWNASTPASRTAPTADGSNGVSPTPPWSMNTAPASAPIAATERMPPTRATVWLRPGSHAREILRRRGQRGRRDRRHHGREPEREEADARDPPRPGVGTIGRRQQQEHGDADRRCTARDRPAAGRCGPRSGPTSAPGGSTRCSAARTRGRRASARTRGTAGRRGRKRRCAPRAAYMTSVTRFALASPGTRRSDGGTTGSRAFSVQTTRPTRATTPTTRNGSTSSSPFSRTSTSA